MGQIYSEQKHVRRTGTKGNSFSYAHKRLTDSPLIAFPKLSSTSNHWKIEENYV